ncbi:group II intron maturase-specific domain-containing protein [Nonomuraea sp. NPDC049709]|uniref:group II intron maturase-specific domain-containing protein n=1 Tax=Nonomuraea sp. NPDC049709 TaxID=3154736 RepID=UPI00342F9402
MVAGQRKRGTSKLVVYTRPSARAVQAIKDRISERTYRHTCNQSLAALLSGLNRLLAGWAHYFRHGVSKKTFAAIDRHAWQPDRPMAPSQTPDTPQPSAKILRPGLEIRRRIGGLPRPVQRRDRPLPIPRIGHPDSVDHRTGSRKLTTGQDTWRARCGESRTADSGRRLGETDRWQHRHRASSRPHKRSALNQAGVNRRRLS